MEFELDLEALEMLPAEEQLTGCGGFTNTCAIGYTDTCTTGDYWTCGVYSCQPLTKITIVQ